MHFSVLAQVTSLRDDILDSLGSGGWLAILVCVVIIVWLVLFIDLNKHRGGPPPK